MTGDDVRLEREAAGASRQEIALLLDTSEAAVEAIEDKFRLTRSEARTYAWALWVYRRDVALAAAGIPECLQAGELDNDLESLGKHFDDCELCRRRTAFVEAHLPEPPRAPGLFGAVTHVANSLEGWKKSAFAGGMLLVYVAGVGAPIMLLFSIIRREPTLALAAIAFLPLLFTLGAAGGIMYHYTSPLRTKGTIWYYVSFVLVLYTYLATAGAIFWAVAFVNGEAGEEFVPRDAGSWIVFGLVGLVFGIVLGKAMRGAQSSGQVHRRSQ